MFSLNLKPSQYQQTLPYPHLFIDNVLDEQIASNIQQEILDIPDDKWDRYNNPFEQKYTLRNKNTMPDKCTELFQHLESDDFIKQLSVLTGKELCKDESKNFWGIHKYDDGDKLDIHVDAGLHPNKEYKKQVTLGIYLSSNWTEENGGHLEIWKGDNASNDNALLYTCENKILPKFNRLVLFTCDDYSWHGNPSPVKCNNTSEKRIFLTMSYLSKDFSDFNKRTKAFFIKLPSEIETLELKQLRLNRANGNTYKQVYNCGINGNK